MGNATKAGKPSLKDYMLEEEAREIAFDKVNTSANAPAIKPVDAPVPATDLEVKKERGRGRPKSKPESRLASFHLPVELIAKLDEEVGRVTAGNKSLFITRLLENYFDINK